MGLCLSKTSSFSTRTISRAVTRNKELPVTIVLEYGIECFADNTMVNSESFIGDYLGSFPFTFNMSEGAGTTQVGCSPRKLCSTQQLEYGAVSLSTVDKWRSWSGTRDSVWAL